MGFDQKKVESELPSVKRAKPEKVHIIACGAIAREILAVQKLNKLDHIDLHCLPAIYHSYPQKIVPELEKAVASARTQGVERIFIGYADCGTGGDIDRFCAREGIKRLSGPHCYSFFAGNDDFAARWEDDLTSFFLTDFLARQFEAFVIEPLGLDRHPELKSIYFGNYRKVIYLSQVEDPVLQEKAREAARYLELDFEYRFTGYGDLSPEIVKAASV